MSNKNAILDYSSWDESRLIGGDSRLQDLFETVSQHLGNYLKAEVAEADRS